MKLVGKDKQKIVIEQAREDALNMLAGELDLELEEHIHKSCKDQPGYQSELLDTAQWMASIEGLSGDADICLTIDRFKHTGKARRRWPRMAIAASLVLAATVGLLSVFQHSTPDAQIDRYITRVGEQKEITLADGSVLTLNTGTLLLVEMTAGNRRITLERGEAFFDVAKDPDRPFTVALGERSVSVLGTRFNILKSPDRFTLAVVGGVIAVHDSNDTEFADAPVLSPVGNERLQIEFPGSRRIEAGVVAEHSYSSNRMLAFHDADINRYQHWRTGLLSFQNEPLGKVIQELNRYSAKKILIENSMLMDREIYATIRIDQIAMALEGLENSLPIKVVNHFDRIVISDKESDLK